MNFQVSNLKQLITKFSDDATCRKFLEDTLWKGTPKCPKCGCQKSYKLNDGKTYKCANNKCYKKYTVTVGTVFENTNVALGTWFAAMYMCTSSKKGVSSLQLHRQLGITPKTAWYLMHRIRKMMINKAPHLITNTAQADETYIQGKRKNMHMKKRVLAESGKRIYPDTAVMGVLETGGSVRLKVVNFVSKKNATDLISKNVKPGTVLVTDSEASYNHIGKQHDHKIVLHKDGQYVVNGFHTNGIENFWSILKRGIYGIYHQVSPKHLHRYCDEFSYRFNTRQIPDSERFVLSMQNAKGKLPYKVLISQPQ